MVWLPFFIFPYIGLLIIPIDVHIFQRGGPTNNQSLVLPEASELPAAGGCAAGDRLSGPALGARLQAAVGRELRGLQRGIPPQEPGKDGKIWRKSGEKVDSWGNRSRIEETVGKLSETCKLLQLYEFKYCFLQEIGLRNVWTSVAKSKDLSILPFCHQPDTQLWPQLSRTWRTCPPHSSDWIDFVVSLSLLANVPLFPHVTFLSREAEKPRNHRTSREAEKPRSPTNDANEMNERTKDRRPLQQSRKPASATSMTDLRNQNDPCRNQNERFSNQNRV